MHAQRADRPHKQDAGAPCLVWCYGGGFRSGHGATCASQHEAHGKRECGGIDSRFQVDSPRIPPGCVCGCEGHRG